MGLGRFRIVNVRANVTQLGQVRPFGLYNLVAAVSIIGPGPPAVITPTIVVGSPLMGVVPRIRARSGSDGLPLLLGPAERNENLAADPTRTDALIAFELRFAEGYPGVFRTRSEEAGGISGEPLGVTNGTRFLVR